MRMHSRPAFCPIRPSLPAPFEPPAVTKSAPIDTRNSSGIGRFKLTPPAKGRTAWTQSVLYSFCSLSNCSDGANPTAALIADEQGTLYGTTFGGGSSNNGTVFKLTPPAKGQTTWTETVLYRFKGGSDGLNPQKATLIADKQNALYGTTPFGGISGISSPCGLDGCGTVFKLTPPAKGQTTWTETVLYRFKGSSDGGEPFAALIADEQDALYGTANFGGNNNNGLVFKLTPPAKGQTAWTQSVLYTFCSLSNCSDGAAPQAALIADKQGALYSTTVVGGSGSNRGTVFKLTPPAKGRTAWTETVLYSFKGGSDGANPQAALIAGKQGALYSTTIFGGGTGNAGNGNGTVFKLVLCPEREKDHDHDGCPDFQSME